MNNIDLENPVALSPYLLGKKVVVVASPLLGSQTQKETLAGYLESYTIVEGPKGSTTIRVEGAYGRVFPHRSYDLQFFISPQDALSQGI